MVSEGHTLTQHHAHTTKHTNTPTCSHMHKCTEPAKKTKIPLWKHFVRRTELFVHLKNSSKGFGLLIVIQKVTSGIQRPSLGIEPWTSAPEAKSLPLYHPHYKGQAWLVGTEYFNEFYILGLSKI